MSDWPIDWTGLSDQQREALEHLIEQQKKSLFIGTFPPQTAASFREANTMMQSGDAETRSRGERFEASLFAQCGYTPPPPF